MKHVLAIAGLPGSGKSHLARELADLLGWPRLNDPLITYGGAAGAAPKIIERLVGNPGLILDDPYFCRADDRDALARWIESDAPRIRWVYFANDPHACLLNLLADRGERLMSRVRCLASLQSRYVIPEGAAARPVWRPGPITTPAVEVA